MNTSALWNSLQSLLQEMDGAVGVAVDSSFFQSLFNGLVKEGEILGSLHAEVHWTPSVFAMAQKDCVDSFFSQNSFITYEALQKLGIPQPSQFLQSRYPDGISLETTFAHPSIIEMLDVAVEDAIERLIRFQFYPLPLDLFDEMEKEMETLNIPGLTGAAPVDESRVAKDAKVVHDNSTSEVNETSSDAGKGSKKKKRKSSGNSKMAQAERGTDNQESAPSARKDEDAISEEWVIQKITSLNPDFEGQGLDDPEMILLPLARHLRPLLLNSWKERRKAAFTDNSQKMKKLLDNLQKKLDESFLNMQLYEKALDLFEDDQSTSVLLHKHLLRTTGTSMVDTLLVSLDMHNKLKNGVLLEPQIPESISLGPGDRSALAKSLPGVLSAKAIATVEALEGKRVESFMSALREVAEEGGLALKKLDKKLERTLLHSYRKDLTSQVSAETDPVSLLPQVISLLYVQVYGKALQAPGRAISACVSRLKSGTVSLLALMAAATGDEEDCTSDRILSKREPLEELMPALKGLVLVILRSRNSMLETVILRSSSFTFAPVSCKDL
ncbi:hypothetical protein RND71_009891 [Anisodus tanguticus]|uniref:Uncharacterized protein n=1 Tax=Anisodus tanguticus TaxID=243964 RepID=A0AAE1SKJ4_9SOLA|nr:hypothetical protein RND71_009891 [Anisodus tanguticus]